MNADREAKLLLSNKYYARCKDCRFMGVVSTDDIYCTRFDNRLTAISDIPICNGPIRSTTKS